MNRTVRGVDNNIYSRDASILHSEMLISIISWLCVIISDNLLTSFKAIMFIPYYYICIHNEPYNVPNGEKRIARDYDVLCQLINIAHQRDIKLTMMFTAQWADYISADSLRLARLNQWVERGHEIAAHHHNVYHINWDGYTDYPAEGIKTMRQSIQPRKERFLGNLNTYVDRLLKINSALKTGCMNAELDKSEMPDKIVYDTSLGAANFGEGTKLLSDLGNPEKGINEFISVASYRGIERKWVTHFQINNNRDSGQAMRTMLRMQAGTYGVVMHSFKRQLSSFAAFIEFLYGIDPSASHSRTISEVIEQRLIPEKPVDLLKIQALSDSLKTGGQFVC
jgi:hypothetical protein